MDIRPIRTIKDYEWALAEVAAYFDSPPAAGSAEADRFDVLSDLIEVFENRHYPMPEMEPVEALKAFMQETGRGQADLARLLGARSRASEILGGKRPLSVGMIYRISKIWGLPADLLIGPPKRAA
ncbi:MAG: XRE family transcriptional regulator [Rhizobiales bacterium]|nr:XRE family transcriptional regulator [Hyphomicrobiales bacterium]